jgi:hypothetical protein
MQINIPTPCHEDWGKMSPSEKGRFCDSCHKDVHDFTRMKDEDIIATVAQPGANVCGHIHPAQLHRINARSMPNVARKAAMLAIISSAGLSFMTGTAMSQNGMEVQVNNQVVKQSIKVTGVVTSSESGTALAGVTVVIRIDEQDKYVAYTDEKGFFSLDIPLMEQSTLGLLVLSSDPAKYGDMLMSALPWNDQHHDVQVTKEGDNIKESVIPEVTVAADRHTTINGGMAMTVTTIEIPFGIWSGPKYVMPKKDTVIQAVRGLPFACKPKDDNDERYLKGKIKGETVASPDIIKAALPDSLSGTVVDEETGEPIPFAAIQLMEGDLVKCATGSDENGKFKIAVPANSGKTMRLKVSALGYFSSTIENALNTKNSTIKLTMTEIQMLGIMVMPKYEDDKPGTTKFTRDGIEYKVD